VFQYKAKPVVRNKQAKNDRSIMWPQQKYHWLSWGSSMSN